MVVRDPGCFFYHFSENTITILLYLNRFNDSPTLALSDRVILFGSVIVSVGEVGGGEERNPFSFF